MGSRETGNLSQTVEGGGFADVQVKEKAQGADAQDDSGRD
jgi:hypothetical protein